jgi:hypothetical protein
MMQVTAITRLDSQAHARPFSCANQRMVHSSGCQSHGNGNRLLIARTIGKQQGSRPTAHKVNRPGAKIINGSQQGARRIKDTVEHCKWQLFGQTMLARAQSFYLPE